MDNEPGQENSARICQASGMVSVQAGCTIDDALVLLRQRARTDGTTLEDAAVAVVERRIRLGR